MAQSHVAVAPASGEGVKQTPLFGTLHAVDVVGVGPRGGVCAAEAGEGDSQAAPAAEQAIASVPPHPSTSLLPPRPLPAAQCSLHAAVSRTAPTCYDTRTACECSSFPPSPGTSLRPPFSPPGYAVHTPRRRTICCPTLWCRCRSRSSDRTSFGYQAHSGLSRSGRGRRHRSFSHRALRHGRGAGGACGFCAQCTCTAML